MKKWHLHSFRPCSVLMVCECVVKKPVSAFPSMFWSKLSQCWNSVQRVMGGDPGAGLSISSGKASSTWTGPANPETGCGLSLQVTLALLERVSLNHKVCVLDIVPWLFHVQKTGS